jgi:hypothetical protein
MRQLQETKQRSAGDEDERRKADRQMSVMQSRHDSNFVRHAQGGDQVMSPLPTVVKDVQALYETLKVIQKGSEDDFELRASADESIWGVRLFDENPSKPTYVLYAGPDAKELACDAADYDLDDDEDDEDDE